MAALTPGYFPANYFTHGYWQTGNQYWTEYGSAAVGAGAAVEARRRRVTPPPPLDDTALQLIRDYLEVKLR
jgi:hypothetical protein